MTTALAQDDTDGDVRTTRRAAKLAAYVSARTKQFARSTYAEAGKGSVPFSRWSWRSITPPGKKLGELRWMWRLYFWCRFLNAGGILVIVGNRSVARKRMLQILPLMIVDHSRVGARRNAPVTVADMALGPMIIDETASHDRNAVFDVVANEIALKRGLGLVFPDPETFMDYEIAGAMVEEKVLFLELTEG